MTKYCSIFIDNTTPISTKIVSFLQKKYGGVFLVGEGVSTKINLDLPYMHYSYIQYNNIDLIFQDIKYKEYFVSKYHKYGYIYDPTKHNMEYDILKTNILDMDFIITDDYNVTKELLRDIFSYSSDILYV